MSANLGFFAEDRERDFPELNKCPDCETFFADANRPICGKECPEEFRAGNRKPIKQKKHRRSSGITDACNLCRGTIVLGLLL